jgi:transcriptional regulator with XRE-family HTH domain
VTIVVTTLPTPRGGVKPGHHGVRCHLENDVVPERSSLRFGPALHEILEERGLTLRGIANRIHVDHAYLSRLARGVGGRRPGPKMMRRLTRELNLPDDFFWEYRLEAVLQQLEEEIQLVDDLYDSLFPEGRAPTSRRRRGRQNGRLK